MAVQKYPQLENVVAHDNYELLLKFSNGENRIYDFKQNLTHPFYKGLSNPVLFKKVSVRDGEIMWATGQDFCPHTLYDKSQIAAD